MCGIMCCGLDKTVPINYILLAAFTFAVSFMVSHVCMRTEPMIVLQASCLTFTVALSITYYAATTTTDFTLFGPILTIVGWVFCMAGFLYAIFGYHHGLIYSTFGALLFSFYLLFDTQMILGGDNKRYQYDEDSYILASMALYMDIINLLLYIIQILNDSK